MKNFLAFLSVCGIALVVLSASPYSYLIDDAAEKAKVAVFGVDGDKENPVLVFYANFRKTLRGATTTLKPLPDTREHSYGWAKVEESVTGETDGPVFSSKSVGDN